MAYEGQAMAVWGLELKLGEEKAAFSLIVQKAMLEQGPEIQEVESKVQCLHKIQESYR